MATPPERKTGLRRYHVKSRHGCGQCKARRKKCDEKPPVCSNCKRRKLHCDYEDLVNARLPVSYPLKTAKGNVEELNVIFESGQSVDRFITSKDRPEPASMIEQQGNAKEGRLHDPNARPSSADAFRLLTGYPSNIAYSDHPGQANELMFHFFTIAADTLAHNNKALQCWQRSAYIAGHTHEFVRHTLLAFSSLHIAHLQPQEFQKYLMLTSHHHAIAIRGFREQVQTINGSNCDAIFIFSALLVLTELGLMRPVWDGVNADINSVDKLMQQLTVVRDILALWRDAQLVRSESIIRELVGHGKHPYTNGVVPEAISRLSYLEVLNDKTVTDLDERLMYSEAIRELKVSYFFAFLRQNSWFAILRWAKGISPAFVMRVKTRHPLALLILAQYCVLVHKISHNHWWMTGWSEHIFNHVVSLLDNQWMPYLGSVNFAMDEIK